MLRKGYCRPGIEAKGVRSGVWTPMHVRAWEIVTSQNYLPVSHTAYTQRDLGVRLVGEAACLSASACFYQLRRDFYWRSVHHD